MSERTIDQCTCKPGAAGCGVHQAATLTSNQHLAAKLREVEEELRYLPLSPYGSVLNKLLNAAADEIDRLQFAVTRLSGRCAALAALHYGKPFGPADNASGLSAGTIGYSAVTGQHESKPDETAAPYCECPSCGRVHGRKAESET